MYLSPQASAWGFSLDNSLTVLTVFRCIAIILQVPLVVTLCFETIKMLRPDSRRPEPNLKVGENEKLNFF